MDDLQKIMAAAAAKRDAKTFFDKLTPEQQATMLKAREQLREQGGNAIAASRVVISLYDIKVGPKTVADWFMHT